MTKGFTAEFAEDAETMNFWQTIVVVSITAILAWIGHGLVAAHQRKNEKDRALEQEKRDTYKRFMTLLFSILRQSKAVIANSGLSEDLETRFFEVARDMTIYASDDVLELWIKFKNLGDSPDGKYILSLVGELMAAIRSDLGHTDSRFAARELLSTFVTDINSMELPAIK